jgi:hypothetical protein
VLAPNPAPNQSKSVLPKLRHRCRNVHCGSKLQMPTDELRNAFCCRGCFTTYFRNRCLVCERPFKRIRDDRNTCGRRLCKSELRRHPERFFGKWMPVPGSVQLGGRNPIKPGLKTGTKGGRPFRKIAGPDLSPMAFRFATLPFEPLAATTRAYAELLESLRKAKQRAQRNALLRRQHSPVNVLGGYAFPDAPIIDLSQIGEPLRELVAESVGLDIPEFLRRGTMTRRRSAPALDELSVSDGRETVGTVTQSGDHWTATTVTGERLGPFNTMTEAARALPPILGSSEVTA